MIDARFPLQMDHRCPITNINYFQNDVPNTALPA